MSGYDPPSSLALVVIADRRDWFQWSDARWARRSPSNSNRRTTEIMCIRDDETSMDITEFQPVYPTDHEAWRGYDACRVIYTPKAVEVGRFPLPMIWGLRELDQRWTDKQT